MGISKRDVEHIFERLRSGVVPERGLTTFAVGIDRQRAELKRVLELAGDDEGVFKFLRGGYGCGKTFTARLAVLEAQAQGFATSFVVVSDNDLHFHRFDDVYRKVVQELSTSSCPRGALGDVIDRWIAKVEDGLISAGADENAPDFDEKVRRRLGEELVSLTGGKAPEDLIRVLRTIFELKQEDEVADAGALLSWLSGSSSVAAAAKKRASIKGDITSKDALDYLHGLLEIVKAAGYRGLVIVIDEVETILRMRRDIRGKSLNGIRQICDAADRYHGLLWVFTGTPEFFDTKRGVAGLQPLHDRIGFQANGNFVSLKQPQLELNPFGKPRLKEVALKLRELYPTEDRSTLEAKVSPAFIEALVDHVARGLAGDVGVIPRQFLRRLVDVFDLVDENRDYDPMTEAGFQPVQLNEDEQRLMDKKPPFDAEPEDAEGYDPTLLEF
ncbi:MAG: BREX system ATP-binding protein BrxD [Deltaproteobacteria bacterium]|nr:BREX system ATP-binding protein BrxD [Deltaproteobacteria bacterium]MCB9488917.1 BREX system ATP-binding protein BrxD [Deltaproteobacteria bacterium]